jgi:outer membrane protein
VRLWLHPGVPKPPILTALVLVGGVAACYPPLPGAGGARPAAPTSAQAWDPPASARDAAKQSHLPADTLPGPLASRRDQLTTSDLVALALQRSPETRATWFAAKAAAASYGEARGELFPDITGSVAVTRLKSAATSGRVSVQQTTYGPSVTVNWLLFDFGGRAGAIDAAREGLFSANWTHNATVADVVRRTLQDYFALVGARGLVDADSTSLAEAQVNFNATNDRRNVGVATVSEVLQAQTAVSQAQLDLQRARGTMANAHGELATLIGLPPNAHFDVDTTEANAPIAAIGDALDSLMQESLLDRPDLAAERSVVGIRAAQAREARSAFLPSLSAVGSGSALRVGGSSQTFPSYTVGLSLTLPIFNGFAWEYGAESAELTADAEAERLHTLEQQVTLQVYQTYQDLRTATQSVATSTELLRSASQAVDAARARYREGVGSILELLTAENALASARAQRVQAGVDWHTSLVQLAHDVGLLQPDGTTPLRLAPISPTSAPGGNR